MYFESRRIKRWEGKKKKRDKAVKKKRNNNERERGENKSGATK
jgi:hypothetical protein